MKSKDFANIKMNQVLPFPTRTGELTAEDLLNIHPLDNMLCIGHRPGTISYGPNSPNEIHNNSIQLELNKISITAENVLINDIDVSTMIKKLNNENIDLKNICEDLKRKITELYYAPGAPGAIEASSSFRSHIKHTKPTKLTKTIRRSARKRTKRVKYNASL